MAVPERPKPDPSFSPNKIELIMALADIDRQLEVADTNENPIERCFKRDELLEQRGSLEAEMDALTPPSGLI